MSSFIHNILNQANVSTTDDDPILKRLCEEVVFWEEYIYLHQHRASLADSRTSNALNFAIQRLKSYLQSDRKTVNISHLRHVKLSKTKQTSENVRSTLKI
jgi:hypothetical protein